MDNNLHGIFSALSDPTRRAVIEQLMSGSAAVSDLHASHDMAMPSFMKHLDKLEAAGMVRSEKKGRVRTVHLETGPIAQAGDWLHRIRDIWEGRLNRLTLLAENLAEDSDNG